MMWKLIEKSTNEDVTHKFCGYQEIPALLPNGDIVLLEGGCIDAEFGKESYEARFEKLKVCSLLNKLPEDHTTIYIGDSYIENVSRETLKEFYLLHNVEFYRIEEDSALMILEGDNYDYSTEIQEGASELLSESEESGVSWLSGGTNQNSKEANAIFNQAVKETNISSPQGEVSFDRCVHRGSKKSKRED